MCCGAKIDASLNLALRVLTGTLMARIISKSVRACYGGESRRDAGETAFGQFGRIYNSTTVYFQDTLCGRVHLLTLAFGTGYMFATPGLVEPRPHPR